MVGGLTPETWYNHKVKFLGPPVLDEILLHFVHPSDVIHILIHTSSLQSFD